MSQPDQAPKSSAPLWIIGIIIVIPMLIAMLGVLSALGIYGVRKYLLAAKSAEAKVTIGRMAKNAAMAYDDNKALCSSARSSVPGSPTMIMGRKYQSSAAEWTADGPGNGFACLKFSMPDPQYFMYSYRATGKDEAGDSFQAKANGDLNGDGVLSEFSLEGQIVSPGVLQISPSIKETNPEE